MSEPTPVTAKTLREALQFFLEDDNYVDRLEADALASLITRDERVSEEEKAFLRDAIARVNFDQRALDVLKRLLDYDNDKPGAVQKAD